MTATRNAARTPSFVSQPHDGTFLGRFTMVNQRFDAYANTDRGTYTARFGDRPNEAYVASHGQDAVNPAILQTMEMHDIALGLTDDEGNDEVW